MRASRHGGVFRLTISPSSEYQTLVGTRTLPQGSAYLESTGVRSRTSEMPTATKPRAPTKPSRRIGDPNALIEGR